MKNEVWGLDHESVKKLKSVFNAHSKIQKVILYGSRAMGTHRPNSDIDITLMGDQLAHSDLLKIANQIDDLVLPQKVDLSLFHQIDTPSLRDHILRIGKEL